MFSPTRRLAGPSATLLRRGGLLGGTEWIVPRARLRYLRLDFTALPARQRTAAARIALLRETGGEAVSARVGWAGGCAHVWLAPIDGFARPQQRAAWMPESLSRPRADRDGPRLLQMLEGVEGQVWRAGHLIASQWWASSPSQDAWRRFLRSAGLPVEPGHATPIAEAVGWAPPWARLRGGQGNSAGGLEAFAWRTAIALIAAGLGWQVVARDAEQAAHQRLQLRLEALRTHAMPLLEAREAADLARASIERFRGLQRTSGDYSLMAAVVAPLGTEARLLAWQRQGEELKAKVRAPETDPRRHVQAYEKMAILADVQATPVGDGAMGLEFKLPGAFKAGSAK